MIQDLRKNNPLLVTVLVMSMAIVGGCSSSSGSKVDDSGPRTGDINNPDKPTPGKDDPKPQAKATGQAIDGYIVGGRVYCDGVENGLTTAGGNYTCPAGTKLVRVSGGVDVGFDAAKINSDVSFVGKLIGSTSSKFVTPLSTLAVSLAGGESNFDPAKLDAAVATIKKALGLSALDLNADPATSAAIAKLNAQVNLIVGQFSTNKDDYSKVMGSFAKLLEQRAEANDVLDINGADQSSLAATIQGLYSIIETDHSGVAASTPAELNLKIAKILNAVRDIEASSSPMDIEVNPTLDPVLDYALGFQKNSGVVAFTDSDDSVFSYTVKQYENSVKDSQGKYTAVLSRGIKHIALDTSAISVGHTLTDASIDVAISVESTDESNQRKISAIARGIKISMTKGDSDSVQVTIPAATIWHVEGVKKDGTQTLVEIEKGDARVFSSDKAGINISFDGIADWLVARGYLDLTHTTGNFVVTMVISGLDLARLSGTINIPTGLRINVGDDFLAGQGMEGFVTVLGDDAPTEGQNNDAS